jgi:hypothetical protein
MNKCKCGWQCGCVDATTGEGIPPDSGRPVPNAEDYTEEDMRLLFSAYNYR